MGIVSGGGGGGVLPAVKGASAASVGNVVGVIYQTPAIFVVGGVDKDTPLNGRGAALTDAYSQWNGNGYQVAWNGAGVDGDQSLVIEVAGGSSSFNADGTLSPVKGVIFPAADPHIVNAWWNSAGTLTRSTG